MSNKVWVFISQRGDFPPCAAIFSNYENLTKYQENIKEIYDLQVILITCCEIDKALSLFNSKK